MASHPTDALALAGVMLSAHTVKKLMENGTLSSEDGNEIFNGVIESTAAMPNRAAIVAIIHEVAGVKKG